MGPEFYKGVTIMGQVRSKLSQLRGLVFSHAFCRMPKAVLPAFQQALYNSHHMATCLTSTPKLAAKVLHGKGAVLASSKKF
jgi:hypothetical protein